MTAKKTKPFFVFSDKELQPFTLGNITVPRYGWLTVEEDDAYNETIVRYRELTVNIPAEDYKQLKALDRRMTAEIVAFFLRFRTKHEWTAETVLEEMPPSVIDAFYGVFDAERSYIQNFTKNQMLLATPGVRELIGLPSSGDSSTTTPENQDSEPKTSEDAPSP